MADAPQREDGPDAAEVRLNRLLNMILETAVEALGFDAATISARHDDDLATIAATDQRMIALDDAQYETGAGPCLDVLEPRDPISLDDAAQAVIGGRTSPARPGIWASTPRCPCTCPSTARGWRRR